MTIYSSDVETIRSDYLSHYVNCFIIQTEEHTICIDTGLQRGLDRFTEHLVEDKKIVVFTTHGHWDHIGLHSYVFNKGADIYGHPGDERFYRDHKWHWDFLFGRFENECPIPEARRDTFVMETGKESAISREIKDDELFEIDECCFQVFHTPGHSKGSVCFYEKKSGILFTGDTLMGNGFFSGIPLYTDCEKYMKSMERLIKMNVSCVFSDHKPVIDGNKLSSEARKSLDCLERIDKAVRKFVEKKSIKEGVQLGEVASFICEKEGKVPGAGACITALAHLKSLSSENEKVRDCVEKYT